jgi:phenylacetate-CoA ligase
MNPFYNPAFLLNIARNYLADINRIWKLDKDGLKRYQDKAICKIVDFAYTVPIYKKKYKSYNVYKHDIKGIDDIYKLPFITKNDLREYYPDYIIPKESKKKYGHFVSTSGSTGKPVFIYIDLFTSIRSLIAFARVLKTLEGSWRKSRIILIIDSRPGSIENTWFVDNGIPFLKKFTKLENIKYLDIGLKPEKIIQDINKFNPDFIGSDPNMLRQLSYLKKIGLGEDIQPNYIFSGTSILDKYTKNYIENAFNSKVIDTYGTTEGGPIAFQCINGNYHVNSDFVFLEFLDDENKKVTFNTPGQLVITKLYGYGTPIIRYNGVDDIVTPTNINCNCGITTQIIKQIEGRSTDLILLPSGKTLSPLILTGIPAKIMDDSNSYKIKQFQIIQRKIDELELLVVIDEKLRDVGIPINDLFIEMKKRISRKIGNEINVKITETDKIQKDVRSDHVKVVSSMLNY